MKNIEQILSDLGIELNDDQKDGFNKEFAANYKTVAEFEKKTSRITELEKQISDGNDQIGDLTSRIGALSGNDKTIEELKEQIAKYEKDAADRKAADDAARHDALLTENIMNAVGERQFANDLVKEAVIGKVKAAMDDSANAGKGAKELLESVTQDLNGVWVNPQQEGQGNNPTITENGGGKPQSVVFDAQAYIEKRGLNKKNN